MLISTGIYTYPIDTHRSTLDTWHSPLDVLRAEPAPDTRRLTLGPRHTTLPFAVRVAVPLGFSAQRQS